MVSSDNKNSIFWFRRDLRLDDNAGLYHALNNNCPVIAYLFFDTEILNELEDKKDVRVDFIYQQILHIDRQLKEKGSGILVKYDSPEKAFKEIVREYDISTVFTNHDYEPYANEKFDKDKKHIRKWVKEYGTDPIS